MTFPTQEHIEAAQAAADYWKAQTGVYVWPSVTLAQAMIESRGWTALAGKNNGFGIKATKAQIEAGDASYVWTQEVVNGQRVKVKSWFANFASLRDAYIAHGRILATVKLYSAAWKTQTAEQFIRAAGPHYATAPDYADVIIKTMKVLDLSQYDRPGPTSPLAHAPSAPTLPTSPVTPSHVTIGAAAGAGGAIIVTAAKHVTNHLPHIGVEAALGGLIVFLIVVAVLDLLLSKETPVVTSANTAAPPPVPAPPAPPATPAP